MILTVIPARGKSKGIPRKNVRSMNGRPLITYALHNGLGLKKNFNMDIVVTTDDWEIKKIILQYKEIICIDRPMELSEDNVPLAPVIYHALSVMEKKYAKKYDSVIIMQVTSPTVKVLSIIDAVNKFNKSGYDTIISAYNNPHLSWTSRDGKMFPLYEKRVNRQLLPAHYEETGGFFISKRNCITEKNVIGDIVGIYELSESESVDIDSKLDWILCENILKSKRILFRVDGEEILGMGHIYRCISLAYHFTAHEVLFVLKAGMDLGINKVKASFFPYEIINDDNDIDTIISDYKPDIVINDILDTKLEYMELIKKSNARIINFEDIGSGSKLADVTINSLYGGEKKSLAGNEYCGIDYFFIRDEFLETPIRKYNEEVKNIVVIFGGSDPGNYTKKVYDVAKKLIQEYSQISIHFILGFGYINKKEILPIKERIYVYNDILRVSEIFSKSDLAVTAQGRTIYELACMGVPSIVLAENKREMLHDFAKLQNGYINLGLGANVDENMLYSTLQWVINTPSIRKEMHNTMLQYDFSGGQRRVLQLILNE